MRRTKLWSPGIHNPTYESLRRLKVLRHTTNSADAPSNMKSFPDSADGCFIIGREIQGETMTKRTIQRSVLCLALCLLSVLSLAAAERWSIGLTAGDRPIEAVVVAEPSVSAPTVLLIGGLTGSDATSDAVKEEVDAFEALPQARRPFRLVALPLANPDRKPLQFPPTGTAYKKNAESHVLWRWIGKTRPLWSSIVAVRRPHANIGQSKPYERQNHH
jgi:hypothetical protein